MQTPRSLTRFYFFITALALVTSGVMFVVVNTLWAYSTPSRSLDGSWAYVLHSLAGNAHFGSDLIFTYGPLGFLIAHGDTPDTYPWRLIFSSLLLAWVYGQMFLLMFRGNGAQMVSLRAMVFFCVFGPFATTFAFYGRDLFPDGATTLAIALGMTNLFRLSSESDRPIRIAIAISLAVLALIKGTLISIVGLFLLIWIARRVILGRGDWDVPLAVIASFVTLWALSGNQILDIPKFIWAMKEISSGFTTGMQADGPLHRQTRTAFLVLSALLALRYAAQPALCKSDRFLIGGLILALGLMLTKHATDRFDGHVFGPAFVLLSLSFLSFLLERKSFRTLALSLLSVAAALITMNFAHKSQEPEMTKEARVTRILTGGDFLRHAAFQIEQVGRIKENLRNEESHFKAVTAEIGDGLPAVSETQTVDIYSYKQGALLAKGMNYKPRPVFQSYSAYTPWLATQNRNFLTSKEAPDRIFFAVDPIDQRLASLEDGLSWFELVSRYKLRGLFTFAGIEHLDLEKTGTATAYSLDQPSAYKLDIDAWQPVHSERALWLKGKPTRRSLFKSFRAQIYKSPIYWLELDLGENRIVRRRLVEPMLTTGLLINPFVDTTRDFLRAFAQGSPLSGKSVRRYRIVCSAPDICPVTQWAMESSEILLQADSSWNRNSATRIGTSAPTIIDRWVHGVITESSNARRTAEDGVNVFQAIPTTVSIVPVEELGLEGATEASICFGLARVAYENGNTDGVEFEIQIGTGTEWRSSVWKRNLKPKQELRDRGRQCDLFSLPGNQTELAFVTKQGASLDWDFAYWSDLKRLR